MDNRQNNIGNERSQGLLQFRKDDFYNYGATDNDGFHYTLAMHKSARLLLFAKVAENIAESQMGGHCIWVDANSNGRYQILDQDLAAEVKLIPTDFVRGKYSHAKHYFSVYENVKNKLRASKLGAAEEQKLEELKPEIDLHLIRLVELLIHDMANIEHIAETIDNKLSLTIRNIADNNDKFIPDLMKNDDEWLHLKFNSNGYYYLDEKGDLQENDNILYYVAFHKTLKHAIFMRAAGPEFKFKTAAVHHLYVSEDDGLGRYKVQTKDGEIIKQFFVPADYVADRYNRFIGLFDDFKKLQGTSDVYSKQTIWCELQDDAIYLINHILRELESDLKQEIDKSLSHQVMSLASSIRNPSNFDEFYNNVVEGEKRMRLQNRINTYSHSLIVFNRRNRTTFIIHINNRENDMFYVNEKIRIFISKYDPDYYVMVAEAWMPKNPEIQQRISSNYRYGNIIKLPNHEKTEVLTFIAKIKNSINRGPDKSEMYEIIRENQSDEKSRILELRKFGDGRLDMVNQDLISSGV